MPMLTILPCLDSPQMAAQRKQELSISREQAASLGTSAIQIPKQGWYYNAKGEKVDILSQVGDCIRKKISISPEFDLPKVWRQHDETRVVVSNETTLQAGLRLLGHKVL